VSCALRASRRVVTARARATGGELDQMGGGGGGGGASNEATPRGSLGWICGELRSTWVSPFIQTSSGERKTNLGAASWSAAYQKISDDLPSRHLARLYGGGLPSRRPLTRPFQEAQPSPRCPVALRPLSSACSQSWLWADRNVESGLCWQEMEVEVVGVECGEGRYPMTWGTSPEQLDGCEMMHQLVDI
jgi:hypothetical protein